MGFADPSCLGILAFKLWLAHRNSTRILLTTGSQIYPIFLVIIECGALYSMALITMMVTYLTGSNGTYIVIDMVRSPRDNRLSSSTLILL